LGKHRLIAHPAMPPHSVEGVTVNWEADRLAFRATGGPLRLPERAAPERTDGLWQATCFELFVKPLGCEGYFEFNFSPSTQWAAYALDGYRAGMRPLEIPAPRIERSEDGVSVNVDLSTLPRGAWRVGLSAVIEEAGGTRSYWALKHPAGAPDFHDDACFALELPAAG